MIHIKFVLVCSFLYLSNPKKEYFWAYVVIKSFLVLSGYCLGCFSKSSRISFFVPTSITGVLGLWWRTSGIQQALTLSNVFLVSIEKQTRKTSYNKPKTNYWFKPRTDNLLKVCYFWNIFLVFPFRPKLQQKYCKDFCPKNFEAWISLVTYRKDNMTRYFWIFKLGLPCLFKVISTIFWLNWNKLSGQKPLQYANFRKLLIS